jgi:hypothetical protein
MLRDWVRLAGALDGGGYSVATGVDLSRLRGRSRGRVESVLKKMDGNMILDQEHGLQVYDEPRVLHFALQVRRTVTQSSQLIRDSVARAGQSPELTNSQSVACDLLCLVHRERSDRSRIITLVAAMDVLAASSERTRTARALLEQFIYEVELAEAESTDQGEWEDLAALREALHRQKATSSSIAVRQLARQARPSDPEMAAGIARATFDCRRKLARDEGTDYDLRALHCEALTLVQDMLRASVAESLRSSWMSPRAVP